MGWPVGGPSVGNAWATSGRDAVVVAAVVADAAANVVAAIGPRVVGTVGVGAGVPVTAVVDAELVLFAHPVATSARAATTGNHDRGLTVRFKVNPPVDAA